MRKENKMASLQWIKFSIETFADERIRIVEKSKNGERYLLVWIRLLCLAGKLNNGGYFILNGEPMTTEKLAIAIGKSKQIVSNALDLLQKNGIIGCQNQTYFIMNWNKHQNEERLEKIRANDRLRQQAHRQKVREVQGKCHSDSHVTVTPQNKNKNKNENENKYIFNIKGNEEEVLDSPPHTPEPVQQGVEYSGDIGEQPAPSPACQQGVEYSDSNWEQPVCPEEPWELPASREQIIHRFCQTQPSDQKESLSRYLRLWLSSLQEKGKLLSPTALSLTLEKLPHMAKMSNMAPAAYVKEIIARGWHNLYPIPGYQQAVPKNKNAAPNTGQGSKSYNIEELEALI